MKTFTLKRDTEEVEIDGKKYTMRGLSGDERDEYLGLVSSRVDLDKEGKPTRIKSTAGLATRMISLSMRDQDDKAVSEDILKTWPAQTLDGLLAIAQKLSGMGDEEEKAAAVNAAKKA